MLLLYWMITPLFAFGGSSFICFPQARIFSYDTTGGLALYSELASMFPNRSGAEVVYLEQAYPKPRFFVSTTWAVIAVLTS